MGFNRMPDTSGQQLAFLRQILDTASVAIFLVDPQGYITQANQRMADMFGCSLEALVGHEYVSLVHPAQREIGRQLMLELLASAVPAVDLERLYWRADQTEFWGHLTGKRFYGVSGEACGLIGVIADISKRRVVEDQLRVSDLALKAVSQGVIIADADGCLLSANAAFATISGYSEQEIIGQNCRFLQGAGTDPATVAAIRLALQNVNHFSGQILNYRKDGSAFWNDLTISPVCNAQGVLTHFIGVTRDITTLKAQQQQLEHMAHFDALTGLPNRLLLADRLHQSKLQALRRGERLAVVYLDLDGFKLINDHHGHEAGDQLLITVASRMKQALREGDTLARLGGDEFVAVLPALSDIDTSEPLLTRLLEAAAQPVRVGDVLLQVSASLGVTFYPQSQDVDADQLLRQADQAMYQAKQTGRNRYQVFDAEHDLSLRGHHESVERIHRALREREFVLYYQPKVNMRTGAVIGAEALIRWQHPEHGLLAPALFLPVIENHALAIDIGEWVIDTALGQMALWQAAGLNIPVSVNLGAYQLQQANFVRRLCDILARHPQVSPSCLALEVMETSALQDLVQVAEVIKACRNLGVVFALDDFGTGYSSLTYLKHLQVALIKIDKSFVRDMLDNPQDLAILNGVLGLAGAFGREVIAEGVETVAHGTLLLQLGCELAQGFGIARPMPGDAMPAWAAAWQPDVAWRGE